MSLTIQGKAGWVMVALVPLVYLCKVVYELAMVRVCWFAAEK
jgi:hypothetical protein